MIATTAALSPFDPFRDPRLAAAFAIARAFKWPASARAARFAGGMGLRPQEWMVLRERDIDRTAGTRTCSGGEVALAKTESSRATVYLSDIALEVIDEIPQSLDPDALLFPSPMGQVLNLSNWRRREWKDTLEKAKIR